VGARATIIIPTRGRPEYLAVALASVREQAARAGAEVIVIDDGRHQEVEACAGAAGAQYVALGARRGANAARNAGIAAATGELLVFLDDDIEAWPGWLDAYLDAAAKLPEVGVFGGPIHARLEGFRRRMCGRESPPITHTDHGLEDREIPAAWSANLAIRADTIAKIGNFDESYAESGEEEEWERRYRSGGGRIRYVAAAGVDHRRAGADATLPALARVALRRGYASRRYDERKGSTVALRDELRTLAGTLWHGPRRRCWNGPLMVSHSVGRVAATLTPRRRSAPGDPNDDFLSGESGTIGGKRDVLREAGDLALDVLALPGRVRLARAARREPPTRNVLVLSVVRPHHANNHAAAMSELRRSRHTITAAQCGPGELGRFQNINLMLAAAPLGECDWLLLLDDDVVLPRGFLDGFVNQAERHDLRLAQPAHRLRSHAGWRVTRR